MKKAYLVLLVLSVTLTNSVNSQSIFSEYESLGDLHNSFLENVKNNFNPQHEEDDMNKRLDYLKEFQISFLKKTNLKERDLKTALTTFEETSDFSALPNFYEMTYGRNGVYVKLNELKSRSIIDDFSYQNLKELMEKCKKRPTAKEYKFMASNMMKKANTHYRGRNTDQSRVLAISLAITSKSADWWVKNESKMSSSGRQNANEFSALIAPWLAADAVGGAISAAGAATAQYVTTGEVGNWGAVGVSAAIGAIAASTGAVGSAVKWIKSWW